MVNASPADILREYDLLSERAESLAQDYLLRAGVQSPAEVDTAPWPVSPGDLSIASAIKRQIDGLYDQILATEAIFVQQTGAYWPSEVPSLAAMPESDRSTVAVLAQKIRERHDLFRLIIGPRITRQTRALTLRPAELPEADVLGTLLNQLNSRANSLGDHCDRLIVLLHDNYRLAMTFEEQKEGLKSEFSGQERRWREAMRQRLEGVRSILDSDGTGYGTMPELMQRVTRDNHPIYDNNIIEEYIITGNNVIACIAKVDDSVRHWRGRSIGNAPLP
jgi:hypothetical protein